VIDSIQSDFLMAGFPKRTAVSVPSCIRPIFLRILRGIEDGDGDGDPIDCGIPWYRQTGVMVLECW